MTRPGACTRVLRRGHAELRLAPDASVTSWRSSDPAMPPLVAPALQGSGLFFLDVAPVEAYAGSVTRTVLSGACGRIEVRDALLVAAEPVGRAASGVALVRLVRALDAALDILHRTALGSPATAQARWTPLNRVAISHRMGRKVTLDGGRIDVHADVATSRLSGKVMTWTPLTVAFDGHLPADVRECRRLLGAE